MAKFLLKTKNEQNIKDKPRVYFACHPDDFATYFEKVCEDIFKSHDCAIYYTENMSEDIPENERETDLGRMNLFVVPVTKKLLTENCRAMQLDVQYAKEEHIHILPLMMESDLDFYYQKPENFGERQYLSPFNEDKTAVDYNEKLKKILESTLISDEMIHRIRDAFDSYIFLSYRKKDRSYANELMKMIHIHPEFRDIAIWYDEFLTPGENFQENISKNLKKCKLFALLVTPSLLEDKNFVMEVEYPEAQRMGKDILPILMKKTSRRKLKKKFKDIPDTVDPEYEDVFKERLINLGIFSHNSLTSNPERSYLIGIAYIEGIDVETDRAKGLNHIVNAAIGGHEDAMEWLYNEYSSGRFENFEKAMTWAHCLVDYRTKRYGETDPKTIRFIHNLALEYGNAGQYDKYEELAEKAYSLYCQSLGETDHSTIIAMCNLAKAYASTGKLQKALDMNERGLELMKKVLGENHKDTVWAMYCLAGTYNSVGEFQKALELGKQAYELRCKILGEKHPDTLSSLSNLAFAYAKSKQYKTSAELFEKAYALRCEILGENNPHTLSTLHSLAVTYNSLHEYEKALELNEKSYRARYSILGQEHPDTIAALNTLAWTYCCVWDWHTALEHYQTCYRSRCKVFGKEHSQTLKVLEKINLLKEVQALYGGEDDMLGGYYYRELDSFEAELDNSEKIYGVACKLLGQDHPTIAMFIDNIANWHINLHNYEKALEYFQKSYDMRFKYFGEEHSQTIISLDNLAYVYSQIGDLERSFELYEKCYELRCKVFGEDDSETLRTLDNLAISYEDFGEYEAAHELYEKCYTLRAEYLGEMNPDTLSSLSHLALSFGQNGNYEKAIELHKKCYELSRKAPKHGSAFDSLFSPTLEYTRNLANAYRQFCDYTNATKYYEKCYAFCRKNYGESDIQTVEAMEDIAFTYQLANNDAKALELYEKSYNLRCNTLGEDHRSSLLIKEYIDGIRKKLSGQ